MSWGELKFTGLPDDWVIGIRPKNHQVHIAVPYGTVQVIVVAPGYYPWEADIHVQPDAMVSIPMSGRLTKEE